MLYISGIVKESIVDGPGLRYVIFVQGCPHHCKGCHNPQTWSFDGGERRDVGDILEEIKANPLLDGVTFSGGEPFTQSGELILLAREVKKLGLNVVVYTGYLFEDLVGVYSEFLSTIDILIDGPFVEDLKSYDLMFKGSSNQRVIDVRKSLEVGEVVTFSEEDFDV